MLTTLKISQLYIEMKLYFLRKNYKINIFFDDNK